MSTIAERVAGAPISWGVCEAPDWGHELPPERVLRELRELGLGATELGPTGYLGEHPAEWLLAMACFGAVTAQYLIGKAIRDGVYFSQFDKTTFWKMMLLTSAVSIALGSPGTSRHPIPPSQASARVTAGLKCAPETEPKVRIKAVRTKTGTTSSAPRFRCHLSYVRMSEDRS